MGEPYSRVGKHVRVPGRDTVGTVLSGGENIGAGSRYLYAVVIHFEETGEIGWYDETKVEVLD